MVHVTLKFEGSSRFSMTVCSTQKILFKLFLFPTFATSSPTAYDIFQVFDYGHN